MSHLNKKVVILLKQINDQVLLNQFLEKYQINQHFSTEMLPFLNLYFFKKNEHICYEDDPIDYLFFFVQGKAKIYITLKNGKSLLLCFYDDFKLIGDLEMVNSKHSTASVQVIEDAYCIGIKQDIVKQKLFNDVKFLQFMCQSLSLELERSSKNSSINLLYPLENRLASYIFATIDFSAEHIPIFKENLTELAELLGSSYRHLHRSIEALCKKKILKRLDKGFEIINITQLKEMAADLYQ